MHDRAFVYCWTDHKLNKLYVGSHKGEPTDGYVCSSKPMLEEFKIRPHDFTRQVVATGSVDDIRVLEQKILLSLDAAKNESFYNLTNGNKSFFANSTTALKTAKTRKLKGEWCSLETRNKIREANSGKKHLAETKYKMSVKKRGANHPYYGKKGPTADRVWFMNPSTGERTLCLPDQAPEGFVRGKKYAKND